MSSGLLLRLLRSARIFVIASRILKFITENPSQAILNLRQATITSVEAGRAHVISC